MRYRKAYLKLGNRTYGSVIEEFCEEFRHTPNVCIEGIPNRTRIKSPILLKGPRPHISGLTLSGVGLELHNPHECTVRDVRVNTVEGMTGIRCGLTAEGRVADDWLGWPPFFDEKDGARLTVSQFENCHVLGDGDGWDFFDETDWPNNNPNYGQFMTHIYIDHGHTFVKGQAMIIQNCHMADIRHHIDVPTGGQGVHLEDKTWQVHWYGPAYVERWPAVDYPVVTGRTSEFFPHNWTQHGLDGIKA